MQGVEKKTDGISVLLAGYGYKKGMNWWPFLQSSTHGLIIFSQYVISHLMSGLPVGQYPRLLLKM